MASPHVAGTAALVWVAYPSWTNADVRTQLRNTANDLGATGFDTKYGYGLVDADEAAPSSPAATGSITGTVTDANTTNPIAAATVTADPGGYSTTTVVDGTYTLADLPVGSYTVTASATGYVEQSKTAAVLESDMTVVDFALTPSTAPTGTMSVKSITFSAKKAGPNLFLYTTVEVVLEDLSTVDGARVEMTLTHESGPWSFAGNTGTDGTVKFTLLKAQPGGYTAEVTLVSHSDYDWDGVKVTENCILNDDGTVG